MPPGESRADAGITRRATLAAVAGLGATSAAGCVEFRSARGSDSGLSGSIDVRGSSTVEPVMTAFAQAFTEDHPDVSINVTATGTGAGFGDFFCEGTSDFNNASRAIRGPEEEQCADAGVEYVRLQLATDALTVIVNNDADFLECLTVEELAEIWARDGAQRWSDVRSSFPDESIQHFGPADTSGTYDYFSENVLGEDREHIREYQATEDDNTILSGVAGDPHAIGYFGFAFYYSNPDAVTAIGVDDGDGCVVPSLQTASSGEYSTLSRPLYTYVSRAALERPSVAEFARFAVQQSTSEQIVAERVGYVPQSPEGMGVQLDRLNRAIAEVSE